VIAFFANLAVKPVADRYYERTRLFWDGVRDTWSAAFAKHPTITLKGPVDKLGLFIPLFERADEIEGGQPRKGGDAEAIRAALAAMGVPF